MTLAAERVSWERGGALVVDGVTLRPRPGATVGLLGPNGSGKSSLLRLLSGVARPTGGAVLLDGAELSALPRRRVARTTAVVGQHGGTDVDLRVRDVVDLGRVPHRGAFGGDRAADAAAVGRALEATGLTEHAERAWHRLSGGEQQRAHIARALAQEPRVLLLDEPTNHLDVRHQLELLGLVARLPLTCVVALHDLNLAAMFCDELVVLRAGRAVAAGTPEQVLTPELIARVYGVRAEVVPDEGTGRPTVRYRPGALPATREG